MPPIPGMPPMPGIAIQARRRRPRCGGRRLVGLMATSAAVELDIVPTAVVEADGHALLSVELGFALMPSMATRWPTRRHRTGCACDGLGAQSCAAFTAHSAFLPAHLLVVQRFRMFGSSAAAARRAPPLSLRSGGWRGGSNRDDAVQPLSEENVVKAAEGAARPDAPLGRADGVLSADAALIRRHRDDRRRGRAERSRARHGFHAPPRGTRGARRVTCVTCVLSQ